MENCEATAKPGRDDPPVEEGGESYRFPNGKLRSHGQDTAKTGRDDSPVEENPLVFPIESCEATAKMGRVDPPVERMAGMISKSSQRSPLAWDCLGRPLLARDRVIVRQGRTLILNRRTGRLFCFL